MITPNQDLTISLYQSHVITINTMKSGSISGQLDRLAILPKQVIIQLHSLNP